MWQSIWKPGTPAWRSYGPTNRSSGTLFQGHFSYRGTQYLMIGPAYTCDLGHVESGAGFHLSLYVTPNNFKVHSKQREACELKFRHWQTMAVQSFCVLRSLGTECGAMTRLRYEVT